jgi:hypothetical protein
MPRAEAALRIAAHRRIAENAPQIRDDCFPQTREL